MYILFLIIRWFIGLLCIQGSKCSNAWLSKREDTYRDVAMQGGDPHKLVYFCLACPLKRRRHIGITMRIAAAAVSASQKNSVTFFSGTTQASFLIFVTEHQYRELYRVMRFWICGMSTSCFKRLWIFKRKEVGRRHMSSLENLLLS